MLMDVDESHWKERHSSVQPIDHNALLKVELLSMIPQFKPVDSQLSLLPIHLFGQRTARRKKCITELRAVEPIRRHLFVLSSSLDGLSEEEANKKRREEAGGEAADQGQWRWTLNWDSITDDLVVGSCPRSPSDLDRIVDEAGATAVLSLQCDLCLEALSIDWEAIYSRGVHRGVVMSRVPIRDFDHGDQTLMLPEAVRTLAILLALKHRVYVHCTAGINRATLTTLGYFTFVEGWGLHSALNLIKEKRPQAHPYIDCWKTAKAQMLNTRSEEVATLAKQLSSNNSNIEKDSLSHWLEAEDLIIKETFRRQLTCSVLLVSSLTELKAASVAAMCILPEDMEKAQSEIEDLKINLEKERADLKDALHRLETESSFPYEVFSTDAADDNDAPSSDDGCSMVIEDLTNAREENLALKQVLRDIAETSTSALAGDSMDELGSKRDIDEGG